LVVRALAAELNLAATATSLRVRATRTAEHATTIKRTSEVQARVLPGSDHSRASVILIPVPSTPTPVLATTTRSTSAVLQRAPEPDRAVTAITIRVRVTCIAEPAISTESTSAATTTATELRRTMDIVITPNIESLTQ